MSPVALCLVSDPLLLSFVCQTGQKILISAFLTLLLIGRILFVNKRFHLFQRIREEVTPLMMNIPVVCYLCQFSYLVFVYCLVIKWWQDISMLVFLTNLTNLCLCLIGDHANFTEKETQAGQRSKQDRGFEQ